MALTLEKALYLEAQLQKLYQRCIDTETKYAHALADVHPNYTDNAKNLVHYLALRNTDLRAIQMQLSEVGLSSLGRAESHVLFNLNVVLEVLQHITKNQTVSLRKDVLDIQQASMLLQTHDIQLFKKHNQNRRVKIMVTLPTASADDPTLVQTWMETGMNVARINCAHDTPKIWSRMIENVHKAKKLLHKECPVFMDLAGPKLRTKSLNEDHETKKQIVQKGDLVQLVGSMYNKKYKSKKVMGCSLDGLFESIAPDSLIKLDDGKIEAICIENGEDWLLMRITHTGPEGGKIKKDMAINLPDSKLNKYGLTEKDRFDLEFITSQADGLNMSFVNRPEDVTQLIDTLQSLGKPNFPFILKIETQEGFKKLPLILLEAMKSYPIGVFIARGDLAVECGWQRMAEIQEEILWLCEAACIPNIWGTQVLENLVKTGIPSRAEITDAAMAQRAECVMLNKGPYVKEGIQMLHQILSAMQEHQHKKVSTLRKLSIADI